ncbi:hypothetical protein FA13DRAFT_1735443 [Coprinellus micaceus]|uniref:Uncharacterized protein n=1 Tax=Coprinellus micaceus TaxID=71717 RepID=A0A4Y7T397_COPMI|nr:hypothetical protein FA13DRAFT_1735443 [Coprinellus micaceus]
MSVALGGGTRDADVEERGAPGPSAKGVRGSPESGTRRVRSYPFASAFPSHTHH